MRNLNFRLWLELIDREKAKRIVLDAAGVPENDENIGDVLSSVIKQRPDLEQKLMSYSEIKPYQSKIIGWMRANQNKTLQQLIDFIASMDGPPEPNSKPVPSVGTDVDNPANFF